MTRLCVSIFVHSLEQAKSDIARATESGADTIELRMDLLPDAQIALELATYCRPTVWSIITCRSAAEGGQTSIDEGSRLEFLNEANGSTFTDIELSAIHSILPRENSAWIVSAHDFKTRPPKLYSIVEEMNAIDASVNKIVWQARSVRDNFEALELLINRQRPTIALCMGEAGLISRILAKKFGAFLTFAALDVGKESAPGQITIEQMKQLYRWDAMRPSTKVFGVIGSPVAHSLSPAIHNAAFDATGFDGVYLPLLVEPSFESFKAFVESAIAFAPLDLSGLSITIPHKENALRYLKAKGATVEPLAESIGAVNTIVIERAMRDAEPVLRGYNTDHAAILDALEVDRTALAGKRVAVIGAGGTARAAVAAMASLGATIVIYNRTLEKAVVFAAEFSGRSGKVVAAKLEKLCDSCCDIFINTTSVGMHPNIEDSPWGETLPKLSAELIVFDAIYNPMETKFIRQAKAAGAKTIGGVEMFVRQAVRQFELFTGLDAPVDVMRNKVVEALQPSPLSPVLGGEVG